MIRTEASENFSTFIPKKSWVRFMLVMVWKMSALLCENSLIVVSKHALGSVVKLVIGASKHGTKIQCT